MSSESSDLIAIFNAASDLPIAEQLPFLEKECQGNEQMIAKLLRLLQADELNQESDFMEWPRPDSFDGHNGGNWIGKQVGNYLITQLIGEGSSGLVFLAKPIDRNNSAKTISEDSPTCDDVQLHDDEGTTKNVAIKLLQSWQHDRPGRARFRREAEAIARVNHPCVIRLIEFGTTDDGVPYIVMPFVEGKSLQEGLQKDPELPLKVRISLLLNICDAVNAAHQELVIHRDLKPSNVLIEEQDDGSTLAIVTDFSTAKFVFPKNGQLTLTTPGSILGTPGYLAPEQVDGSEHVTLLTDVHGLGGVLYFLLTGQPPFQNESTFELLKQVKAEDPVLPQKLNPTIPTDLQTICLKCLSKNPKHRYQSVAELAADVRRWSEGEPILARRIGNLERAVYWSKRNPIATIFGLASLVTITTFLVALTVLWQSAEKERQRAEQTNSDLVHVLKEMAEAEKNHRDDPAKTFARVDMLRQMVWGFEQIEARGGLDDTELLEASAAAWYNFLRYDRDINGKYDEKATEKAISQFSELSRRYPQNHRYKFDLFHCNHLVGRNDEALRIIRELVQDDSSGNLDYRDCLASSLTRKAIQLVDCGEVTEAIGILTESIAIYDRVIEESSQTRQNHFRYGLGRALYWRSRIRYALGKTKDAKADAGLAIENREIIYQEQPTIGSRHAYGESIRWMATIHLFENNVLEAERLLDDIDTLLPEIRDHAAVFDSSWGFISNTLLLRWMLQTSQHDFDGRNATTRQLNDHFDRWKDSGVLSNSYATNRGRFILLQNTSECLTDFQSRIDSGEFQFYEGDLVLVLFYFLKADYVATRKVLDDSIAAESQHYQRFSLLPYFQSAINTAGLGDDAKKEPADSELRKLLLHGQLENTLIARRIASLENR